MLRLPEDPCTPNASNTILTMDLGGSILKYRAAEPSRKLVSSQGLPKPGLTPAALVSMMCFCGGASRSSNSIVQDKSQDYWPTLDLSHELPKQKPPRHLWCRLPETGPMAAGKPRLSCRSHLPGPKSMLIQQPSTINSSQKAISWLFWGGQVLVDPGYPRQRPILRSAK